MDHTIRDTLSRRDTSPRISPEKEQELLKLDYACSKAEAEYSGLFTPLGILRAVQEEGFSREERQRALTAVDLQVRQHFGGAFELFFHQDMWERACADPSTENLRVCIDAFAESIRASGEFCVKHADREALAQEAITRKEEGDWEDPLYCYISGREAFGIADALQDIDLEADASFHIFYAIGHVQHLAALVEKLRAHIDDGSVVLTDEGYDASEALEIIGRARDSLVRSLGERDWEADRTGIPTIDLDKIDKEAFANTQKIAESLRSVQVRLA